MSPDPRGARPFDAFAAELTPLAATRERIAHETRRPEAEAVAGLIAPATFEPEAAARVRERARRLIEALRAKRGGGGVEALIHEYALSSQEGVALMCLAEALLRVPDDETRDALIRDKLAAGDWRSHVGQSPSLFVNAATWGLVVSGKLASTNSERGLAASLARLISRGGEPLIRKGVDLAMRMMGEQFVSGTTIEGAIANGRAREARGYRHSYDMLGEAAVTADDARRYFDAYAGAIDAIGIASAGRGIYDGPGISIKLSALHPRYARAQRARVIAELLPRLLALALRARAADIGLNIDAEEVDRLGISLDLLEALCADPRLAGWNGVGFVVQAYAKCCPAVVEHLIELARRTRRRLMVRLVKGAYWDSEIKRAQVDGLDGFAVYTRKAHTDLCYLACARRLLAAPDAIYPQFATHNAQTLAAVVELAGRPDRDRHYEFQCLHGMGEPLYDEVVSGAGLGLPCRIYAPVGTHETLLAYLVRRLLENGANTSFVNRINDMSIAIDTLLVAPADEVRGASVPGAPHPAIALPRDLFGAARANSAGIDLTCELRLGELSRALTRSVRSPRETARAAGAGADAATSTNASGTPAANPPALPIVNPADPDDLVGSVVTATPHEIAAAIERAATAAARGPDTTAPERAHWLERAADLLEQRMPELIGLAVREAGKSIPNAVGEVREAVDFLRYYAHRARVDPHADRARGLGAVACISPWNFPLAIFTGQVAAALAAGDAVLAKPAEETPLIAALAVRLLHEGGVPPERLQLLPGDGRVGAALVADARVQAVMFTGSTEVARSIQRALAERLDARGQPVTLVAETGGQNAMIVDSSALAEQVVGDAIASAFDSAGQRCSALRVLCVQDDVADRVFAMLEGAMRELSVGNPDRLAVDVGPVISRAARDTIEAHVAAMRARGRRIVRVELPSACARGTFVAPTLIEIESIAELEREVFGPVLHLLRFRRDALDALIDAINATGYGLTFGLHTRIDETIARVAGRIAAGNVYVNRNTIGAVVGVQPFGGRGLSGTGPKAGGPLMLARLRASPDGPPLAAPALAPLPRAAPAPGAEADPRLAPARAWCDWLLARGHGADAARCAAMLARTPLGRGEELPGPVGERNQYRLVARGRVAAVARTAAGLYAQIGAALATANRVVVPEAGAHRAALDGLAPELAPWVATSPDWRNAGAIDAVLFEGEPDALRALNLRLAALPGAVVAVVVAHTGGPAGEHDYPLERLVDERVVTTNTTAAGGNASLMTIG